MEAIPAIVAYALQVMGLVPAILQGVEGAVQAYETAKTKLQSFSDSNTGPTADDFAALSATTDQYLAPLAARAAAAAAS